MKKLTKIQTELTKIAKSQGMTQDQIDLMLASMPIDTTIKAKAPNDPNAPVTVTIGDYEGKPTISLQKGVNSFVNRPFTFGKAKAQMIVSQYEAIKKFAEAK